ncbi:M48 family metallopeptidase [Tabrizicola oligotrophica]|uniref:M48 family metallopeptidase n=1 Tax=Tabrizicola oligotrophica TaxID=2710650 RepID=A0A6M0QSI8_9RHOB|nr:SprT family zinc-dependent metalloprotease [Tabrizicola oligotrophica]NEY90407.1 M48 family metallopeptidase [Tabrizicola oligotrophica]
MPVLPGPPPLEITLRRSARARRFSLRVSRVDGRITLSLPVRAREAEAMAFARSQEGWLRDALARLPQTDFVGIGSEIPVEGRPVRLVRGEGRKIVLAGDSLQIPGDPAQAGARAQAWLKALARDRLVAASDHYAAVIGHQVARVTLRDTRSRWGSCSHDGALMYSWRLILAPPPVLAYVAAHEVAHMLEMNHSDRFWAVVERLYPGWQAERRWLHSHGTALHALRFTAAPD